MGRSGDARIRILAKCPLQKLRSEVESLLEVQHVEHIQEDEVDEDEHLWIAWGELEGFAVAEFSSFAEELDRLLYSNCNALSETLSCTVAGLSEARHGFHYQEFDSGKLKFVWSEMNGPTDWDDAEDDWVTAFEDVSDLDDTEEYVHYILKSRLGLEKALCEGPTEETAAWRAELAWYSE